MERWVPEDHGERVLEDNGEVLAERERRSVRAVTAFQPVTTPTCKIPEKLIERSFN